MMQSTIDFTMPMPLHMHNGTHTSRAAAVSMRGHASTLRGTIVAHVARCGGCTCDEVEMALSLSHQCCSARIAELHAPKTGLALLFDSGTTRKTRSGRAAVVWVVARRA